MSWKRFFGIFQLCLLLSVAWHLFGLFAIGTTEQPAPAYAQTTIPTLMLRLPVDTLFVGADSLGRPVTRALTSYADPEFFGFPRAWTGEKYQARMRERVHVVPGYCGNSKREFQISFSPRESFVVASGSNDKPSCLPHATVPDAPLSAMAQQLARSHRANVFPANDNFRLAIRGKLSERKSLVQVMPAFGPATLGKSHNLLLGRARRQRGEYGLVIRLGVVAQGDVRFAILEGSSGDMQLDNVALRAVRQWRFDALEGATDGGHVMWGKVILESGASS